MPSAPQEARPGLRPSSSRRISWDLLRVLCVLLVVLYHATQVIPDNYPGLIDRKYVFPHQIGASLLLVISAYFVCATLGKRGTLRWWWGRMARLLPGFLAATVLAWVALKVVQPAGGRDPGLRELAANLVMAWNWDRSWGYLDGSYWTIPMQLLAFTVAAVLWRRWAGSGAGLRLVLWAAVLVPIAQLPLRMDGPELYGVVVDGLGFHRAHLFVAGVTIYLWSQGRLRAWHGALLLAACMLGQLAHNSVIADGTIAADWIAYGATCGILLLMLLAATGPDWTAVVPPSLRPVVTWLAGISFGVYLVHQTVGMTVMLRLQEWGVGPTLQTVALVANAVLVGWLLTRFVERPAHRALLAAYDRWAARRAAAREPVPSYVPAGELARDAA